MDTKEPEVVKEQKKEAKQVVATVDDFSKIDIRVGKIVECWKVKIQKKNKKKNKKKHPESENLYCEKIDIGTEVRQIASGL